ncbi:hypothetical protein [Kribbella sancticallisti]
MAQTDDSDQSNRVDASLGDALIIGMTGGNSHDIDELGIPFQTEVGLSVGDLGLTLADDTASIEDSFPSLPPFPVFRPRASGLEIAALVGFGVYLAKKLSDPTIDALGEQLYAKVVGPAVRKLWGKMRRGEIPARAVISRFDHWFDGSGVLVRVVIVSDRGADAPDIDVIPAALRQAAEWLQSNAVTHRVLTYEIIGGRIPATPRLSEPI